MKSDIRVSRTGTGMIRMNFANGGRKFVEAATADQQIASKMRGVSALLLYNNESYDSNVSFHVVV